MVPSVVTRTVSGPTSACSSPFSARITVRQTPLIARLSPGDSSPASGDATRSRTPPLVALRSINSPTASTRPVNISLYQDIGTERFHMLLHERSRGKLPSVEQFETAGTNDLRRDVKTHVIDEAFVPRARVHRRAAFEQERSDPPRGKPLQRRPERAVARHLDLRAAVFERPPRVRARRRGPLRHDNDRAGVS